MSRLASSKPAPGKRGAEKVCGNTTVSEITFDFQIISTSNPTHIVAVATETETPEDHWSRSLCKKEGKEIVRRSIRVFQIILLQSLEIGDADKIETFKFPLNIAGKSARLYLVVPDDIVSPGMHIAVIFLVGRDQRITQSLQVRAIETASPDRC